MSERIILHCDLNNFFATVECRDNPGLQGHPVAVCGSAEKRHGIILAKNELAKSFRVKTAETVGDAQKKCPGLILIPPSYQKYSATSKAVQDIYQRYTDLVEPFGIDECWLDVTGSTLLFGNGYQIAKKVKKDIARELDITISVGLSFTKVFAKLGSDLGSSNGIYIISPANYRRKVWPLPIHHVMGIGWATTRKLEEMSIYTIGDLAHTPQALLWKRLGKYGQTLWNHANGIPDSPVLSSALLPPEKSISHSETGLKDLTDDQSVWRALLKLSDQIAVRMRKHGVLPTVLEVSLRDIHLNTQQFQTQIFPTRLPVSMAEQAMRLFLQHWRWQAPLRSLGICGSGLIPEGSLSSSLFQNEEKETHHDRLYHGIDRLSERYGKDTIIRGNRVAASPYQPIGFGISFFKQEERPDFLDGCGTTPGSIPPRDGCPERRSDSPPG